MNTHMVSTYANVPGKLRNRIAGALGVVTSLLYATSASAYSLDFDTPTKTLQSATGLGSQDPAFIVFTVVNTSLIFLGTLTLIMIIVAGFMWLTAAGSEEKITKAKEILQGTIIGLVIVFSSFGLAQFVFNAVQRATIDAPVTTNTNAT